MIIYTDSSFNEKSKVAGIGWNTKKWVYRINQISPEEIILGKVKAHTGHYQRDTIQNALADLLAKEGVIKFLESQGTKQKPKPPCIFVLPDQNQR